MTLYITGGHLTPALAVIDELQKRKEPITLQFFGREFSQSKNAQISRERFEIESREIPFIPIQAAKFHRTHILENGIELLKFPLSLWQVISAYRKHRPDVVLSFGGYLAFPACLIGKFFGARVITHEQTRVAGLANQVIGWFADAVAIAHEESAQYFFPQKVYLTGNPIRDALFREYKTAPAWFTGAQKIKPIVYITGGSQGSHIINQTITSLLPKLARDYYIVHQCGVSPDSQTLKDLETERAKLPQELQDNYTIREWIEEREVSYLIRNALFVISRAGANTVQELTLAGTPAIFIPLAFAYKDEQFRNASHLAHANAAILIHQKDLVPDVLYSAIVSMQMKYAEYKEQMLLESAKLIRTGTNKLLKLVLQGDASVR